MGGLIVVAVIGLALALFGWMRIRKLRASRSWAVAQGTIIGATVGYAEASSQDDEGASYFPQIQYQFPAFGYWYTGTRIRFDERRYAKAAQAQQALRRFPPGSTVPVFYNPQNPNESVLVRSDNSSWVLLGLGVLMLVLAGAAALR